MTVRPIAEPSPSTVTIGGDLAVASIGFGAMQLTGQKVWGEYPDHDRGIALLREVVDDGVTFIDTADVYGPHSNEVLIREALHPYPDNLVIASRADSCAAATTTATSARREPEVSAPGRLHEHAAARCGPHRPLLPAHADVTDAPFEEQSRRSPG